MYIKPKKRLGQNFLIDKNIQKKIIAHLEIKRSDVILEIGAGRGELTGLISVKAKKVFALEIDKSLCQLLSENLNAFPNTQIICQDILKVDLEPYFKNLKKRVKVFGNIPYYISTPIIDRLFKFRKDIDQIFITVQKEFAERVVACAGSKEYGSLSCFVQYYAEPKIIFNIKKTCFFPVPKVDSCLLRLEIKKKLELKKQQEKTFFKIVRASFNKRRKTLRNSLKGITPLEKLNQFFAKTGIDVNTRPEDLSQQDFINLVKFN